MALSPALVDAAGIFGKMYRVEKVRMENWDREINIDLRGSFLVARNVGERMARRRHDAIVNVASVAGMTSGPIHAYTAAKADLIQITQTLAAEWGRSGVRVNAVSPGFTRTAALEAGLASGALNKERLFRNAAMKRLVEPIEMRKPSPGCCRMPLAALPVSTFRSTPASLPVRHGTLMADRATRRPGEDERAHEHRIAS
jgi:NAD(P)-dependent dehydrogenase (short-subunit alcohol dehydrogenase family)